MKEWWKQHSEIDKGGYKENEIEDATGCIPLLLDKCVVDERIDLTSPYLRDIYRNAVTFVQGIQVATERIPERWEW